MESKLFENLYKDNAKDIYRYCYFRLKNAQDAEDIVSETFIEAFKNQFNDTSNIRPWLFKVARNTMYDKHFRRQNLETNIEDSVFDSIEIDTKSLEQIVLDEESIKVVKDELQKLDPSTSEVISLRVWDDLKFSDISIITGKNEDSVKKIFYRGLDKLKSNINSKPNYHIKSFTLPVILSGILAFGNSSYFNLSGNSLASIAGSITSNLNITNFFMNSANTVAASSTAATTLSGVSAKTATAGFFSTTAAKIIIGAVGTASIVGGGVGGAYVINEYNRSNELEPVSFTQVENNSTENLPTTNAETTINLTKECNYTKNSVTIDYKVPSNWNCKYDASGPTPFGEFSNDKFKFSIGFLFEAICQDPNQQCSSENIYTGSNFNLDYVENQNSDGSKYYKLAGSFYLNNGDGIKETNSYSKATKLPISMEDKKVLKTILDSFEIKEVKPFEVKTIEKDMNFNLTVNTSEGGTRDFPLTLKFTIPEGSRIEDVLNNNTSQYKKIVSTNFNLLAEYFLTSEYSAQYTSTVNIGSNADLGTLYRAVYVYNGTTYTTYISNYQNSNCYNMGESVNPPCGIPSVFNTSVFKGQLGLRCEGAVEECDKAVLSMKVN